MEEKKKLIHEAVEEVGVHRNTLLDLERRGIIHPSRTLTGHRRYSKDDLQKVRDYYGNKGGE